MSLDLVKQFHALVGAGNFGDALALFADEASVIFHGPANNPLVGRYQGREAVAQFFAKVGQNFDIQQFEAQEFIDAGATIVVLGQERSKVKATGKIFDVPWVQIWRTADGKITELTDFFDTGSMAEAF